MDPNEVAQERYIRHKRLEDARERVIAAAKDVSAIDGATMEFRMLPRRLTALRKAVDALIELENQS